MAHWAVLGMLCLVVGVYTLPAQDEGRSSVNAINPQVPQDLQDDCARKDSIACAKVKFFSFVDKMLGGRDSFALAEGVSVVRVPGVETGGAPRSLPADGSIETLLFARLQNFLDTHTLKVDLKGSDIVSAVSSTARSFGDAMDGITDEVEEGRGKKKKKGDMLGPLMAAGALKAAILGKLALAAIALIAGKALIIGKIALVLSAIIGLKKLLGGGGKHVTYEVVAHPQHSSSHVSSHETVYGGSGGGGGGGGGYGGGDVGGGYGGGGGGGGGSGHGGWGRSLDAQQLAYRAHVPSSTKQ